MATAGDAAGTITELAIFVVHDIVLGDTDLSATCCRTGIDIGMLPRVLLTHDATALVQILSDCGAGSACATSILADTGVVFMMSLALV